MDIKQCKKIIHITNNSELSQNILIAMLVYNNLSLIIVILNEKNINISSKKNI